VNKEKRTASELAALIMREIREFPECDHIARVAITRLFKHPPHQPNWCFSWSVNGSWPVPEAAFKIAEKFQAQADLALSDRPEPSGRKGAVTTLSRPSEHE
jgi:hypothetical protein